MAATKLATASQSIASSLRGLTAQAVHVKIHPRPRNLAESREILRVLQQYGEVVVYKHLKVSFVSQLLYELPTKESIEPWLIDTCVLSDAV